MNRYVTAVSSAIGYAAGGETGSSLASNMDRYNRQLHQKELDLIAQISKNFAEKEGISEEEATKRLMAQALSQVSWQRDSVLNDDNEAKLFLLGYQRQNFFVGETEYNYFFTKDEQERRSQV